MDLNHNNLFVVLTIVINGEKNVCSVREDLGF
jgi:hypothetical protein